MLICAVLSVGLVGSVKSALAAKTEKKSTEEPNAGENHIQTLLPLTADSLESPATAVAIPQQFRILQIAGMCATNSTQSPPGMACNLGC